MTAAQPTCWSRKARTGSSVVYGSTTKPSSASCSAAARSSTASGSSVRSSPITSSLTQSVPNASRASLAVSTASEAVAQPAVLGRTRTPSSLEQGQQRALARRVHPPDGDGGHGRSRRLQGPAQDVRGWSCPRCRAGGATPAPRPRSTDRPEGAAPVSPRSRRRVSPDEDTPMPAYGDSVPGETPPTALTIAGSDSGGGAGVQADLKTFAAHRVHGTCALTAVTAQNTLEVRGVVALEPAFVRQQVQAVLDDFDVRSVKTGMLANASDRRRGRRHGRRGTPPQAGGRSGPRLLQRSPPHGARRGRRLPRAPAPPRARRHTEPARGRGARRHRRRVPRDRRRPRRGGRAHHGHGRPLRRGQGRPPHRIGR